MFVNLLESSVHIMTQGLCFPDIIILQIVLGSDEILILPIYSCQHFFFFV